MPYHGKDHNDYVNGAGFCCEGKDKKLQTYGGGIGKGNEEYEKMQYYDHADHLGSSSYITNLDAQIVQHVEYVPFGEVFIEERNQSWNTPYLFNGKELDEETGLYYYGARYYNPRESVWLSTDPLSGYNPVNESEHYIDGQHNGGVFNSFNHNTYGYTYQNPITMVDPNGKQAHFMHGTGDWDAETYFKGSFKDKFKARFGKFYSYQWSGSLYSRDDAFWNKKEGRITAGHRIAKKVIESIKSNISGGKYRGKGIAIGGHSHGANVARVVAKDVYKALSLMVEKGELDKVPVINLVMVNVPVIPNELAYRLTPIEKLHINSIQVDSKLDLVAGLGQEFTGSSALKEFYPDVDKNSRIEYKDQLEIDFFGCGMSNHCGHADANVKVWYPKVEKNLK